MNLKFDVYFVSTADDGTQTITLNLDPNDSGNQAMFPNGVPSGQLVINSINGANGQFFSLGSSYTAAFTAN